MNRRFIYGSISCALLACSQPPPPQDAANDRAADDHASVMDVAIDQRAPMDAAGIDAERADAPREIAYIDAPVRDRYAPDSGPRCYGLAAPASSLLEHVAHIPRESGGSSSGASGCAGDVDNDGVREFVVPRFNEPSELIGADLCSRGRVLLPNYTRGCTIADVDGDGRNELIAYGNDGWDGTGTLHVGRVERATASDWTLETHVFRDLWPFDERRAIATFAAPHASVIDLDRNGRVELFVAGNYRSPFVRVWEFNGAAMPVWTERLNMSLSGMLNDTAGAISADLDADGAAEALVVGSCAAGQHAHRVFRRWDQAPIVLNMPTPSHVAIGELDGVSPPEVLIAHRAGCYDSVVAAWPVEVHRFNGATNALTLVARAVTGIQQREANHVAAIDVTGTAAQELLYCSTASGVAAAPRSCVLYALSGGALTRVADPRTGTNFRWDSPTRTGGFDGMIIDDLDGDGARDIFLVGQEHIDVLRGPRR